MFSLVVAANRNSCFRCSTEILTVAELSVEHKEAWMRSDDPVGKFFDLDNIAFSHKRCNIQAAHKPTKYATEVERRAAIRKSNRDSERRSYTQEKRRRKFIDTGH